MESSRTDLNEKTDNNSLADSIRIVTVFCLSYFSVNVLFRLHEMLMFLLSWLSFIFSSFYTHTCVTKVATRKIKISTLKK